MLKEDTIICLVSRNRQEVFQTSKAIKYVRPPCEKYTVAAENIKINAVILRNNLEYQSVVPSHRYTLNLLKRAARKETRKAESYAKKKH